MDSDLSKIASQEAKAILQVSWDFQDAVIQLFVDQSRFRQLLKLAKIRLFAGYSLLQIDCLSLGVAMYFHCHAPSLVREIIYWKLAKYVLLSFQGEAISLPLGVDGFSDMTKTMSTSLPNMDYRDLDLFTEVHSSETSAAIIRLRDQKVLLANQKILTSSGKTAGDITGKKITALWDPDNLEELNDLLERNGQLTDYEYKAYSWVREEDSCLWRRRRKTYGSDFRLVEYLGEPCRLSFCKSVC